MRSRTGVKQRQRQDHGCTPGLAGPKRSAIGRVCHSPADSDRRAICSAHVGCLIPWVVSHCSPVHDWRTTTTDGRREHPNSRCGARWRSGGARSTTSVGTPTRAHLSFQFGRATVCQQSTGAAPLARRSAGRETQRSPTPQDGARRALHRGLRLEHQHFSR